MKKMPDNINIVSRDNLCIGCGCCEAVCPKKCISPSLQRGIFVEKADESECIKCGKCLSVCSYNDFFNIQYIQELEKNMLGNYSRIVYAKTRDEKILEESSSGGVITTLIHFCLTTQKYDAAFLVDKYNYDNMVCTKKYVNGDLFDNTPKSRYITVNHSDSVKFILNNPNKRVIFIGTSCVISSLNRIMEQYNLCRDNYLLIGLFCDLTMTHLFWDYFSKKYDNYLKALYYKCKDTKNGWPGDMRLFFENGAYIDLDKTERIRLKKYFQAEKCLYCLDKMNINADISVGDDYVSRNGELKGSSTVIIRSKVGEIMWSKIENLFFVHEQKADDVYHAQCLDNRRKRAISRMMLKGFIKTDDKYVNSRVRKWYEEDLKCIADGCIFKIK